MCDLTANCVCHEAVLRAYGELKDRNVPNTAAFDSAVTVFRYHHPEIPVIEARYTVADWLPESD